MSEAPARLRGTVAGLLTAALTLAAHSAGGGALPAGASAIQLFVVAGVVGGVASSMRRARGASVMALLLAAGQLAGHGVLAAHGDHHGGTSFPTSVMVATHVGATVVGAVLISIGDRLCHMLSRVSRGTARHHSVPVTAARSVVVATADQPLRAALSLASSMSHRGPPAGAFR